MDCVGVHEGEREYVWREKRVGVEGESGYRGREGGGIEGE